MTFRKKIALVASLALSAGLIFGTPTSVEGAWYKKVARVIAAPVVAPVKFIEHPNVDNALKATVPVVAEVAQADKELGVSKKIEQATALPAQAQETMKNVDKTTATAQSSMQKVTDTVTQTLRDSQREFGSLAIPIHILLGSLIMLVFVKIYRTLRPIRAH